jgi:uncharacterized membrane protein
MDTRRMLIGTLVGGVALLILGYLIFDLAFAAFYAANAGSATGVQRDAQLLWAVALGSLSYAALITLAMAGSTGSSTMRAGIQRGAAVGFLLWLTADFTVYGITNIANLTRTIADPLLELLRGGIAGGIIAAVLARIAKAEPRAYART